MLSKVERDLLLLLYLFLLVILSERDLLLLLYLFLLVILSERGPRRTLQPGGGESKDLLLFFNELLTQDSGGTAEAVPFQNRTDSKLP